MAACCAASGDRRAGAVAAVLDAALGLPRCSAAIAGSTLEPERDKAIKFVRQ